MAQKYLNVKDAAGLLGISEAEVKQMLERRELHGYRDGTDWKFKAEDIERLARERTAAPPAAEDESEDVLLSEVALGQSDPSVSGTVIGVDRKATPADSDIRLAESDLNLGGSSLKLADSDIQLGQEKEPAPASRKDDVASKVSQFEELDLTLDQDLTLEDSNVASAPKPEKPPTGDSAVDLSGKKVEDEELVLGGSGAGSDITIGGDSGISLVDPADSGLSLEAPLNLSASTEESLELGEDDLLAFSSDTEAAATLKSEDDFQLTPMDDGSDGDDSESGSQVIALDTEAEGDEAATMVGSSAGVASMLEEDLNMGPGLELPAGPALMGAGAAALGPDALGAIAPAIEPVAALPEAPYTIWNVLSLVLCSLVLILVGMMTYDLLRNMWSWQGVHPVNSGLMDGILNLFEK